MRRARLRRSQAPALLAAWVVTVEPVEPVVLEPRAVLAALQVQAGAVAAHLALGSTATALTVVSVVPAVTAAQAA